MQDDGPTFQLFDFALLLLLYHTVPQAQALCFVLVIAQQQSVAHEALPFVWATDGAYVCACCVSYYI